MTDIVRILPSRMIYYLMVYDQAKALKNELQLLAAPPDTDMFVTFIVTYASCRNSSSRINYKVQMLI